MNIVLAYVQYDSAGTSAERGSWPPKLQKYRILLLAKGAFLRPDEIAAVPESNAESGASSIARNSS